VSVEAPQVAKKAVWVAARSVAGSQRRERFGLDVRSVAASPQEFRMIENSVRSSSTNSGSPCSNSLRIPTVTAKPMMHVLSKRRRGVWRFSVSHQTRKRSRSICIEHERFVYQQVGGFAGIVRMLID